MAPAPTIGFARYAEEKNPAHPLANKRGVVAMHRRILYDKIGPGEHHCHWCDRSIIWSRKLHGNSIYVDHLDDHWDHNGEENLVPSCYVCNLHRKLGGKNGRTRIEVACPQCGVLFLSKVTALGEPYRKHCSKSCSISAQWKTGALRGKRKSAVKHYRFAEHRRTLHEKIGPGPHPCHWCGKMVDWIRKRSGPGGLDGVLVVDHLDSKKTHNDPSNLVPSCAGCNANREHRKHVPYVEKCETCGADFTTSEKKIRGNPKWGKFCSRACRSKAFGKLWGDRWKAGRKIPEGVLIVVSSGGQRARGVKLTCQQCGKETVKRAAHPQKFCSSKCYGASIIGMKKKVA